MRSKKLLYTGLALAATVAVLNLIALKLSLYWTVGWYDYMMHFLGGLTIGVLVAWIINAEFRSFKIFLLIFLLGIVIGGLWELMEYMTGQTVSTQDYSVDTVHDLVMDSLGLVVAYYYTTRRKLQFS